ncbi:MULTISPECIES: DUF6653 family protein [unclassified Yoonia]|uniref:DUF6653 family protein n=1 Tax=unclassified Yoonia TaxID=2629118 RepID=UPI002AFE0D0F|nr:MULTISPECIES: DUF6653 family protein [unclassified Yoonia]
MPIDLGRASQWLMTMNDDVWVRHTNPWSGWSRVSILPLLALAVWSRIWIGWWALVPLSVVLLWTWLNPRVFPPPASVDNWMSMGVTGERIWLARSQNPALAHHAPIVRTLVAAATVGAVLLFAGLVMLNLTLTMTGLAVTMLSKLWILDRMVWIYSETGGSDKLDLSD